MKIKSRVEYMTIVTKGPNAIVHIDLECGHYRIFTESAAKRILPGSKIYCGFCTARKLKGKEDEN